MGYALLWTFNTEVETTHCGRQSHHSNSIISRRIKSITDLKVQSTPSARLTMVEGHVLADDASLRGFM